MKKAIVLGSIIPFVVYVLFSLIFVGVLGVNVQEVATISFGKLVALLGVFTMLTSYFVLTFALEEMFVFDLAFKRGLAKGISIISPLILFLLVQGFGLLGFVKILSIGGVVSGGIMGVLVVLMNYKSKKLGNRKPEYSIKNNWFIISLLSLIFLGGLVSLVYYV